jgi:hypothetical protein
MLGAQFNGAKRANESAAAIAHPHGLLIGMIKAARFGVVDQCGGGSADLHRSKEGGEKVGLDWQGA